MSKYLSILGIVALALFTGAGFLAWASAARHVSVTFHEGIEDEPGVARILELSDRVGALHEDVRALAGHLGESLEALDRDFEERLETRTASLERELTALRAEQATRSVGSELLLRELQGLRESMRAGQALPQASLPASAAPSALLVPPVDQMPMAVRESETELPAPARQEPVAAPRKKSFLAFELPSDSFRFDRRATWTVLSSLSRVGFDAKSTLHDFSGVTSRVEGTLIVDPSRPEVDPRALIRVSAATLATGVEGRDEAMRENLSAGEYPEILFVLERFAADSVDVEGQNVAGSVHGTLTIRGLTRPISMSVSLTVDDARRLTVEGETTVHLPDFEVPVPNKLGVISMEKDVRIWIALKLRTSAVTED